MTATKRLLDNTDVGDAVSNCMIPAPQPHPTRTDSRDTDEISASDETATERTPLLSTRTDSSTSCSSFSSKLPAFRNGTTSARFWAIFSQVLIVQFLVYFDATITASSHPVITSYFGAASSASWLSTSFLLTSTAFQSLLGRLSDAVGRKPIFVLCLVIFALATTWCSLAWSIESLIVARAFCGLGAGGLTTVGNIITSDLVPIERRGLYQPYSNIIYGLGGAAGAALGGFMAETLGWRWEFGIQVPVLALCLCISLLAIPRDIGLEEGSKSVWTALKEFDIKGAILLATSTTGLVLGLNLGGNILPWTHPLVISSFSAFAICVPIFIWVESHVPNPIMPITLIWHSPRANLLLANFIGAMLTNSILFNMPIFFRAVLLTTATSSGLRFILPSLISSITSALTGLAITRTRHLKWPLLCGSLCYLFGSLPFLFITHSLPPLLSYLIFIPSFFGQGFLYIGAFISILSVSSQSEQGAVISALLLWRNLGMVVGIAGSSLIVQNALGYFLDQFVVGEAKNEVIRKVLASVEVVKMLEEPYQGQVIQSFEWALRGMFACCAVLACVCVLAVLPVRLPRLLAKQG